MKRRTLNFAGKLAKSFIDTPITPVLVFAVLILGIIALMQTPREENPQIDVPFVNVTVQYPGASSKEVQEHIVEPLSRILKEMTDVKHVYGEAANNAATISVRFKIGTPLQEAQVKTYDRVMKNMAYLPKGVPQPLVRPVDINDVPIITLALASKKYNEAQLYTIAQWMLTPLSHVENVSAVGINNGKKRQFNVELDPKKLESYQLSPDAILRMVRNNNLSSNTMDFEGEKYTIELFVNGFIHTVEELEKTIVNIKNGAVVYLEDVADVYDATNVQDHRQSFVTLGVGSEQNSTIATGEKAVQVTLFVAKKKGSNAVVVANDVLKEVENLKKRLPSEVELLVTRNDGYKADDSVNTLVEHLGVSIVIVVILLLITLGWRESLIVSVAIPLVLCVTLFVGMMADQTINRITLFALILSLGLLVDDAIVVIENIHCKFTQKVQDSKQAIIEATNQIGVPTTLATFTVMFAFFPMFFVTGMMGPYMAPIPFFVPVAMLASLFIAYIFTPWAALRFLKADSGNIKHEENIQTVKTGFIYRVFDRLLRPVAENRRKGTILLFFVVCLTLLSLALPLEKLVLFKMLPGANKNTFNIMIELPTGSSVNQTHLAVTCIEDVLKKEPSLADYESFIATGGVIDFNALLKGKADKVADNIAEIRLNLTNKHDRSISSMQIVSEMRSKLAHCTKAYDASIKLVEDPPGPPVLATMQAEIYGPDDDVRRDLAQQVERLYRKTKQVVDIDILGDDALIRYVLVPKREKIQLLGLDVAEIERFLNIALEGEVISVAHPSGEKEQVGIFIRFRPMQVKTPEQILELKIKTKAGKFVSLGELVDITEKRRPSLIESKDLGKVTYVVGEMDKRGSVYALLDLFSMLQEEGALQGFSVEYDGNLRLDLDAVYLKNGERYTIRHTGEWEITFDVFRDLGNAFAIAVLIIFLILFAYYKNIRKVGIVLVAIPLTFIGVLPGHMVMNWLLDQTYFTATSMIGFIALAGIVIRNSLLLADFTKQLIDEGESASSAAIKAAAIRFRPIMLTASALMLASFVIILDPVWRGLAVSLIFGTAASTLLTLIVLPILLTRYYSVFGTDGKKAHPS